MSVYILVADTGKPHQQAPFDQLSFICPIPNFNPQALNPQELSLSEGVLPSLSTPYIESNSPVLPTLPIPSKKLVALSGGYSSYMNHPTTFL